MENKLPDSIQHLADAIEKQGLKIAFGLQQQGHIPYIEETLIKRGWSYHTWRDIGKKIGWDALSACCDYYDYLNKKSKWISVDDEVPYCSISGNWDGLKSEPVLTKDKDGKYQVGVMYKGVLDGNKFADFYTLDDYELHDITHFQYIID